MTDAELVAKKLAFVETACRELREVARLDRIRSDVRERRFVEHTLRHARAPRAVAHGAWIDQVLRPANMR